MSMWTQWNRYFVVFIIVTALCTAQAENKFSDTARSEWFFPQTKSWIPIDKLPPMDLNYFKKAEKPLRKAYNDHNFLSQEEGADCSFVSGILKVEAISYFRVADLNADGLRDVIYTGMAICQEGDATFIWFGKKDGYEVATDSQWPLRVLKVKMGKDPEFSSSGIGCCDDPIDTFYIGTLSNPKVGGAVRTYKGTAEPDSAITNAHQFQNKSDTILRSSPMISDRFDEDESSHQDLAVFGNIISKYLGGAKGRVIFTQKGKAQRLWAYVVMSEESNPLRYHIAYPANVGWILMETSSAKKRAPASMSR